jgi:LacI family transcriptional regulator
MKDVARIAGVSTSTVSHVINKDRFVSEAITPKSTPRSRPQLRAVCAGAQPQAQSNPHHRHADYRQYQSVLLGAGAGVERSCFERGYSLVLCNTEGDEQRMNVIWRR